MKLTEETTTTQTIYLTKRQAAAMLQISERTLCNWMDRKLVSFLKIGRTVRFRRADLETVGTFVARHPGERFYSAPSR
jgi:excisionase family DNA binding protein